MGILCLLAKLHLNFTASLRYGLSRRMQPNGKRYPFSASISRCIGSCIAYIANGGKLGALRRRLERGGMVMGHIINFPFHFTKGEMTPWKKVSIGIEHQIKMNKWSDIPESSFLPCPTWAAQNWDDSVKNERYDETRSISSFSHITQRHVGTIWTWPQPLSVHRAHGFWQEGFLLVKWLQWVFHAGWIFAMRHREPARRIGPGTKNRKVGCQIIDGMVLCNPTVKKSPRLRSRLLHFLASAGRIGFPSVHINL